MNSNLETFLANFSSLAYLIALVFVALACRRIRAAGGDKAFGVAAWIVFAYIALFGVNYLTDWAVYFASYYSWVRPGLLSQVGTWSRYAYEIAGYLLLFFTAVFAAGCFRSARRLPRKPA
jgi:hypothetical protein